MSDAPLVTIIVPTYNAGEFLVPALHSALDQTHANVEVLVVDDGSTDGSAELAARDERIAGDGRVRFIRQDNGGKSVAMNRALDEARGEFACLLDADDLCLPRRIERLVREMHEFPGVAAVMSGFEIILRGRHVAPVSVAKDEAACRVDIDEWHMPSHDPTLMVRRSTIGDLRYEPELRVGQGYDYILRIGEQWPMRVVPDVLYAYRIQEQSATRGNVIRRMRYQRQVARRAAVRRGLNPDTLFPDVDPPEASLSNRQRDNGLCNHFKASAKSLAAAGRPIAALREAGRSIVMHPLDREYWHAAALALVPPSLASARARRRLARLHERRANA